MKNLPNYFVMRASKRGKWASTPFAREQDACKFYDAAKPHAATVLLLEIVVNPDASTPVSYGAKLRYHAD